MVNVPIHYYCPLPDGGLCRIDMSNGSNGSSGTDPVWIIDQGLCPPMHPGRG